MKKCLSLAVVLFLATSISIGFRQGMSGTSKASRQEPSAKRLDRAAGLDRPGVGDRRPGPVEGASLALVPAGSADETSDKEFARVAAVTGDRLLDRARQSPDNPHLLRQAAAHDRAALAHEPTVSDAGELFAAVSQKLTRLDREIARLGKPGVTKPASKTTLSPAIVKAPAPMRKPETAAPIVAPTPEAIMVGPDGVEIRRVGPRE